jgi:hypothetical protein
MLGTAALVATGVIAAKMADIEGRSALLWGVAAFVAAWLLSDLLGVWWFLAPVPTLVACFAALWYLKERDERRRGGGGKITR